MKLFLKFFVVTMIIVVTISTEAYSKSEFIILSKKSSTLPLDCGISLLIALGIAYAGKKYHNFLKKKL